MMKRFNCINFFICLLETFIFIFPFVGVGIKGDRAAKGDKRQYI